ncbi:hypothetical protein BGX24_002993 [Mortierella sp. AD032]|nr:hypothetical protein BGX24_002993 [Mortierella sp. AD032]
MTTIPTEIVIAIGKMLEGSCLYAGLQVCQEWKGILHPIAWATLNDQQWTHDSFPVKTTTKLLPPFSSEEEELNAEKILSCLKLTRSFTWKDPAPQDRRVPFPPIHKWMPCLRHFSLTVFHAVNMPTDDILKGILDPANMPDLRSVHLDLPPQRATIPIEGLYPIFSKLEELAFHGLGNEPSAIVIPLPIDGAFPPIAFNQPWNLKQLTVDRAVVPFLSSCTALEHLSIIPPIDSITWGWQAIDVPSYCAILLNQLEQLSGLKSITLGGNTRRSEWVFKVQGPMGPNALWTRAMDLQGGVLKAEDNGEDEGLPLLHVIECILK